MTGVWKVDGQEGHWAAKMAFKSCDDVIGVKKRFISRSLH